MTVALIRIFAFKTVSMNYRLKKESEIIEVFSFDNVTRIIIQNDNNQTFIDLNRNQLDEIIYQLTISLNEL